MQTAPTKTSTKHLNELWTRSEAATAGNAVRDLMAHPGWRHLMDAIDQRLKYEQRVMTLDTRALGEATYDRIIGKWAGLQSVTGLAEGIVANGKAAEAAMREES